MAEKYDVLIVGAGPAGIFTALELVRRGSGFKILLLEKGHDLDRRLCPSKETGCSCRHCSPCSVVSGWGGAGAFSDGKLTLSPEVGGWLSEYVPEAQVEKLIAYADEIYRHFGAPEKVYGGPEDERIGDIQRRAILADLKLIPAPIRHLGTGRTQEILKAMREYLEKKGVEIRTDTPVEDILVAGGRVQGIITGAGEEIRASYVVLAPGRQGADWLRQVAGKLGLELAVNPVDVGVRVEVPAVVMEHLTSVIYESKFIFYSRKFDDRVRTFCMNPHGEVVLENNGGLITVNGHSYADKKTENTNFALLVSKTFTEPFKEPIAYGRYIAGLANLLGGSVLVQRLGDLLSGRRSTPDRLSKGLVTPTLKEATPGDLSLVFPYRHLTAIVEMLEAMDKIAPGVFSRHTLLYGVEVKFYSSRLKLNSGLMTQIEGLYAAGDGAGVTRGLAQASAAGVIAARDIMARAGGGR
ncbi:MAG: NAD(P)/FAD-dependent oxidoreductase [Moorellaceae bacterium]